MVVFARRRFGFPPLAAAVLSIAGCAVIPALVLSTSVHVGAAVSRAPRSRCSCSPSASSRVRDRCGISSSLGLLAGLATLVRTHGIAITAGVVLAVVARPSAAGAPQLGLAKYRRG